MTLRDIEYAVAVHDHRHFGKAAEACRVTQSVISTQLSKLEQEVGARLFERTHRKVLPTEAGERFVIQGREVLAAVKRMGDIAGPSARGLPKTIRLGMIPTVAPYLLDEVCARLRARGSDLKIVVIEDKTADLEGELARGRIDCAILATPPADSLITEITLLSEPMRLLVREDHPLAAGDPTKRVKLPADPLLLLRDGNCLRDAALSFCQKSRSVRVEESGATGLPQLIALVRAGFGVTLLPEMAVRFANLDGLRALPLAADAKRTLRAVYRASSADGVAIARALTGKEARPEPKA